METSGDVGANGGSDADRDQLLRISRAPPEEYYEIDVSSHLSGFDRHDRHVSPTLRLTDGFCSVSGDQL